MKLVEQSIAIVRKAAARYGKKPLTDRKGLSDNILRNVDSAQWDPRAKTLRALEEAAAELDQEHGKQGAARHREPTP
jgi:hypothetical protein